MQGADVQMYEPMHEQCGSDDCEVVFSVRNTFIDCENTVSDLLSAEELSDLRQPRGVRRSKTLHAPRSACPSDDEAEDSFGQASDADVQRVPLAELRCGSAASLSSLASSCVDSDSFDVPLCGRRERFFTEDSLASTCADLDIEGSVGRRERSSTEDSMDSQWTDMLAADSSESLVTDLPVRAVRGEWSVGAEGHWSGNCKPCAFLDSRKGCLQGSACAYCHLCDAGEKKRRQREKKRSLCTQRQLA